MTKIEQHRQRLQLLFQSTLKGREDGKRPWSSIRRLHRSGSPWVFDMATRWCLSRNPCKRTRAAQVLSQLQIPPKKHSLGSPTFLFRPECFGLLAPLLHDSELSVIRSTLYAFGHLEMPEAIPLVQAFVTSQSSELRYAATHALARFLNRPEAVQLLHHLCDDPDGDVRNWALFALGTQSDVDTPALRDTLAKHLDDPHPEAREEAIAGLAKRNDERAVRPLIRVLRSGSYPAHHEEAFEVLAGLTSTSPPLRSEALIAALQRRFGVA